MSHFTNNKGGTLVISVKFTLVAFVVSLCFVCTAAIAGDGRVMSSLRFWERDNPQPAPRSVSQSFEHRTPTAEMVRETTSAQTENPRTPQSQHSGTTNRAPVPPTIPHIEREGNPFGDAPPGNAPLSGQTANSHDLATRNVSNPQDVLPGPVFHSSYSFDRRDWVENFHQQGQAIARKEGTAAIQATSLRTPAMGATAFPQEQSLTLGGNESNQWDGQAVMLETLKTAAATVPLVGQLPLDLTPSFQSRLPHTQTRGVVVVQANFPLTEITSILGEIEQLQYDLTYYVGVPAPREKIELCLFKDEASYINFLREVFPRAPRDRRALFIKLDGKPGVLLVQKTKDFEIDLRHEMTHAIVHASIPRVPIWLDEGLAKYFELPAHERKTGHPYLSSVRWNARMASVPSLDRLVKLEGIDDMGAREYRDSWAWVHFMIHRSPETQQLLAAYLQMLATWESGEHVERTGFSSVFGSSDRTIFNRAWPGRVGGARKKIPSLKPYLDNIIPNQRESFREHFGAIER